MKASYFNNTPCTLREEGRMKASCFVNASYSLRKGFKLHDYAMHSKGEMALFFRSALHCFDVRFIVLKYTLLFQISICCFKGHFLVPKCAQAWEGAIFSNNGYFFIWNALFTQGCNKRMGDLSQEVLMCCEREETLEKTQCMSMEGKYMPMRLMNKLHLSSSKRVNAFTTCIEKEDQEELSKWLSV